MSQGKGRGGLWYGPNNLRNKTLGLPLVPASWAVRASLGLRARLIRPQMVNCPVLSVGNLTVGGNGKTPLVVALMDKLLAQGLRVAMVSRGYGRKSRGCRIVRLPGEPISDWQMVGDEPVMVAVRCPEAAVVVGEDRVAAARLAIESHKPDLIICDDAFQHLRLARDLDILAVHAGRGFGNRRLFPRGPLREPLSQIDRADLIVFTHSPEADLSRLKRDHGIGDKAPCAALDFLPGPLVEGPLLQAFSGPRPERVVAACAIAHPDGFFDQLSAAGMEVVAKRSLPDHGLMEPKLLTDLLAQVSETGAQALVVTEKDLVKLDSALDGPPVLALRIEACWRAGEQEIERALESLLSKGGDGSAAGPPMGP